MSIVTAHEGVNRVPKNWYASTGGVNRKLKSIFAARDGVNRKILGDAVTWTFNYTTTTEVPSGHTVYMSGGNSETESAFINVTQTPKDQGNSMVEATYTFPKPLPMRAGQTLTFLYKNSKSVHGSTFSIIINGAMTTIQTSYQTNFQTSYTFNADVDISTFEIWLPWYPNNSATSGEASVAVTVNSDFGSFLLNNSGTSENQ